MCTCTVQSSSWVCSDFSCRSVTRIDPDYYCDSEWLCINSFRYDDVFLYDACKAVGCGSHCINCSVSWAIINGDTPTYAGVFMSIQEHMMCTCMYVAIIVIFEFLRCNPWYCKYNQGLYNSIIVLHNYIVPCLNEYNCTCISQSCAYECTIHTYTASRVVSWAVRVMSGAWGHWPAPTSLPPPCLVASGHSQHSTPILSKGRGSRCTTQWNRLEVHLSFSLSLRHLPALWVMCMTSKAHDLISVLWLYTLFCMDTWISYSLYFLE